MSIENQNQYASYDHLVIADLALFTKEHDLFGPEQVKHFDTRQLDQTINQSAHRALQVCNALAQVMLMKYETNTIDDKNVAQVKAEHIAYDLGFAEFDPENPLDNPFDEPLLVAAWQQGWEGAQQSNHNQPMKQLEQKYWEEGVNTEDTGSQYELCALQLYRISTSPEATPEQAARAKHLAVEMCRYWEGEEPTKIRQAEIDRFMATQTARMASGLDL